MTVEPGRRREVTETAELLATELVTNVVLHARTSAVVVVSSEGTGAFRISVSDGSASPPHLRSYGVGRSTGRGLRLVAVMSREWGVGPSAAVGDAGKEVWFVVPADLVDVDALAARYGGFDLDDVKGAAS